MTTTTIVIAYVVLALQVFNFVVMPFKFGEERQPYSPTLWLVTVIFNLPLCYVLYQVISLP